MEVEHFLIIWENLTLSCTLMIMLVHNMVGRVSGAVIGFK